ncbi:MAG: ROK family protein, partial [Coprobacillus sp.]
MYKSKGEKNIRIQLVKDYFLSHKVASKNDLAQATHLSLATITNILKELQDIHYIERIDDCPSTGGRKAKRYTICAQYMLYGLISLQVIGQQIRVGLRVVNLDYSIIFNENLEYEIITKNQLIEIIQDLQKRFQLIYMSISIPAIVNDGHLTQCDIEGFENWHLLKELKNKVHAKIIIENDVNTAMLGYVYSQSIDKDPIAFIYQPDNRYSGCSLYINKTIVYGSTHFAGELGYLSLASLKEQEAIL